MKHFEIERRFLLYPCSMRRFLKSQGISYESVPILQFYLVAKEGEVLRYRRCGDKYIRTDKFGKGMVREEYEESVGRDEFEDAMERNRGGVIRKRRFVFKLDGRSFELDSFKASLKGLNILEVEFDSEKEADSFELPECFKKLLAAEITDMEKFSNGALSKKMKIPSIETPLVDLLKSIDERESFLKASVKLKLAPYESTAHSLKAILYTLLRTIEDNRMEILEGTDDPERLHQLRVAMRKIRALLSQMHREFEPHWLKERKERLSMLMRKTGPMRDIDVYLGEMNNYKNMLPEDLKPGIEKLEEYLKSKERQLEEELLEFLGGEEFSSEMDCLMKFAKSEDERGLDDGSKGPVIIAAKKALRLRYAKVLKKGERIDEHSPAHEYHSLRIDIKKLRYMIEFFSSLFESDAYGEMARRLKEIQTILGKHQDLDVQREHLKNFTRIEELHDDTTLRAIESLRAKMREAERKERSRFRSSFADFRKTKKLFKKMLCKF